MDKHTEKGVGNVKLDREKINLVMARKKMSVMGLAEAYGVLAIPGMEINTSEEVHAVCLFPRLDQAMDFDAYVYDRLMKFPNREAVFGKQQICNEEDEVIGTIKKCPAAAQFCLIDFGSVEGWVPRNNFFGVYAKEEIK